MSDADEHPVAFSTIVAYSIPMAAMSLIFTPFGMYYMKYAIDVLLVPPAVLASIQVIARVWDGISDPVVGSWSDRTRTRWGRRRPWILGSAIPMALTYVCVWAPPAQLEGTLLIVWLLVAYLAYETASTGVFVPYAALGLELSDGHHDRTRVFAWRTVIMSAGTIGGFGALYWIREAADPRAAAMTVAVASGVLFAVSAIYSAIRVPESASPASPPRSSPLAALLSVRNNPHAVTYFSVVGVEAFGLAIVPQMVVFVLDDVIQNQYVLYWILVFYAVPYFLMVPLWVQLSKRWGKKRLWLFGMGCSAIGFTISMFLSEGAVALVCLSTFTCGIGVGIANVLGPSVAADIVDYDELLTGERKEGAYTAILNLIRKLGLAAAAGLAGFGLQLAGYDPAAEVQSPGVQQTILWLSGGIPAVTYAFGMLLFTRFGLDAAEHARIQLEARRRREADGSP